MIKRLVDPVIDTIVESKGVSRKSAAVRASSAFGVFVVAFLAVYFFAPIEGVTIGRRSSSVGLGGLLLFLAGTFFVLCLAAAHTAKNEE